MKVLFINPPSSNTSYVPPLGVSYLSSVLKKNGHQVFGIDAACLYNRLTIPQIIKKAKEIDPDVIGVTLNLYFIRGGYVLADELKKSFSVPLVAGGPHPKVLPFEVINRGFDIVCDGEGEETFLDILEFVKGNKPLSAIPGILYRGKDDEIIKNPARPLIEDLDNLPFADRSLFPLENYFLPKILKEKRFYFQVFSSRGCPFQCTFCAVSTRKIRVRSPQNVCDEVEQLVRSYGINYIQFMDDLFTSNRQWLHNFFSELKKRELRIKWDCESRVNCVNEELLEKMKQVGLNCIYYGVESADSRTLQLIKKGITVEQIKNTLDATAKVKISSVKLNFILGFPWESKEHILNSHKMMRNYRKKLRIRNGIVVPIPYPATELYNTYHQQYGFTDWWLKGDAFEAPVENEKAVPYFKKNPLMADNFWLQKNFFGYSPRFKVFLKKVILKNEKIAYSSYYGYWRTEIIYLFSRFSLFLYGINPKLENSVFSLFSGMKSAAGYISGRGKPLIKMANLTLRELKIKYRSQHDKERNFDWIERNIYSSLAMPILKLLLKTRVSPNQVTGAFLVIGLLSCLLLLIPDFICGLIAVVLLQFTYVLDYVDGALARAKNQASQKGVYLEKLFSLILGSAILFSAGLSCFFRYHNPVYISLGLSSAVSFFFMRYIYDRKILNGYRNAGQKQDQAEVTESTGPPNAASAESGGLLKIIKIFLRKIDFVWIPIYFIDFIALAFLFNVIFLVSWFYGVFYPFIAVLAYFRKRRDA